MSRRLWQHALSVFVLRHSINVLKVFSTPSLFLVVIGHTCQWTSLLASPPLKVSYFSSGRQVL